MTESHTMLDFAACMQWLVDELYPQAEIIRVALDNLSTHKPAALYETCPPAEARRILKKLELHFTPKHGRWLNMAEIELSIYGRTMKTHLADIETFACEARALTKERNDAQATVNWQFRTPDGTYQSPGAGLEIRPTEPISHPHPGCGCDRDRR